MFEKATVTSRCPKCKKTFRFKIEDALKKKKVKCSCGAEITLDGADAKKKLDEIERLTRQLGGKTFGR